MFDFLFLKTRLKAIDNVALILDSNPFSGPFSPSQIEAAHKNRKMNQDWFIRNHEKLERRLSNNEFQQLKKKLNL